MKKFLYLVCCSLFLFTGCGQTSYFQSTQTDAGDSISEVETSTDSTESSETKDTNTVIYVQIAGAVNAPGVYELSAGARVFNAIDAAGGLIDSADDTDINQAELLTDGQKIYIYTKAERNELLAKEESEQAESDGLININTATVEELTSLPGIGESKANLIVSYREENGDFSAIEDIKNVTGIGDGIFNQIQAYIKI